MRFFKNRVLRGGWLCQIRFVTGWPPRRTGFFRFLHFGFLNKQKCTKQEFMGNERFSPLVRRMRQVFVDGFTLHWTKVSRLELPMKGRMPKASKVIPTNGRKA